MGMFDNVDITVKCPNCNSNVTGFQSKDGPCELQTIPLERVDNLYACCPGCGLWLEFTRRYPDEVDVLPGFDLDTTRFKQEPPKNADPE